jgi:hypothetical protein
VAAIPPNKAATHFAFSSKLNVNNSRVLYCTNAPTENATTTERRIPRIISVAFAVLIY